MDMIKKPLRSMLRSTFLFLSSKNVQPKMVFYSMLGIILIISKKLTWIQFVKVILSAIYASYYTECLVSGKCYTTAWILSVFPVIVLIGYLIDNKELKTMSKRKLQDKAETIANNIFKKI